MNEQRNELELLVELGLPLPPFFWARRSSALDRVWGSWHCWSPEKTIRISAAGTSTGEISVVRSGRGMVNTLCGAFSLSTPIGELQLMEDAPPDQQSVGLCATCYARMSQGSP